jgi:hypothetical protein
MVGGSMYEYWISGPILRCARSIPSKLYSLSYPRRCRSGPLHNSTQKFTKRILQFHITPDHSVGNRIRARRIA